MINTRGISGRLILFYSEIPFNFYYKLFILHESEILVS